MNNDPSGNVQVSERGGVHRPGLQMINQTAVYEYEGIRATQPLAIDRTYPRNNPADGITYEAMGKTTAYVAGAFTLGIVGPLAADGISAIPTEVAKQVALRALKNFIEGAVTSGSFEALFEASGHQNLNWSDILKVATYGGVSQSISFGLFGPEKVIESKVGQTVAEKLPQFAASKLGRAATWVPALAVDSAIWSPQSVDPQKNDYAETYAVQLGLQSGLQGSIIGLDRLGEHAFKSSALGSKILLGTMGVVMINNWVSTK